MRFCRRLDASGGLFVALPREVTCILQSPPVMMFCGVFNWLLRNSIRGDEGEFFMLIVGGR